MDSHRQYRPSPKRCRQNRWPECNNDDQPELRSEAWHRISLAVEERSAPPFGVPLVSNDELARRLGVGTDTLARERAQGRLDGYRFHGEWRYSRRQIDTYLERCAQQSFGIRC